MRTRRRSSSTLPDSATLRRRSKKAAGLSSGHRHCLREVSMESGQRALIEGSLSAGPRNPVTGSGRQGHARPCAVSVRSSVIRARPAATWGSRPCPYLTRTSTRACESHSSAPHSGASAARAGAHDWKRPAGSWWASICSSIRSTLGLSPDRTPMSARRFSRFEGVEDPVAWVGREAVRPRPRTSRFDQKTFRHTSDARRANPWSARLRRSLTARLGCLTDRPLPPLR
jgi:hypothetical protein